MKDQIKALADKHFDSIVDIRKYLHANPELSFKEYETSKYIQKFLTDNNIEFKGGYVKTGIVAHIKGNNPNKKTIALRTDIDALPIQETNDVDYKSTKQGVMHACGHDVHMSSVLGACKILNELKDQFEGTIKTVSYTHLTLPTILLV